MKWGNYIYKYPFNNLTYVHTMTDMFKKYYENLIEWQSITEYKLFQKYDIQNKI
jgi:hypothetical protein